MRAPGPWRGAGADRLVAAATILAPGPWKRPPGLRRISCGSGQPGSIGVAWRPMPPLGVGDEIGGYLIEGTAGRGGMGLVYRARQRRPDRTVALKVIVPELAADPVFRARFERESNLAAEIEHPNVIPVYEIGEDGDLLYIAMRFIDGVDLGALLKRTGPLPPGRAAALDAPHGHGLVHRDIKPGNVLVDASDHAYLTDFGLTKRTDDTQGMTAT